MIPGGPTPAPVNLMTSIQVHRRASWSSVKILYLLCRYYPLGLWFLIMWAYVSDHDAQTCGRVAQAVHTTLAPCVCTSGPFIPSKHLKSMTVATPLPRSVPSAISPTNFPYGAHSCDGDASIWIFWAEQADSGYAGFMLHRSSRHRHLGLLRAGRDPSTTFLCHPRWVRMLPQLRRRNYGLENRSTYLTLFRRLCN